MERICHECKEIYDDLDHWTICPHEWFPDVKEEPYKSRLEQLAKELEGEII